MHQLGVLLGEKLTKELGLTGADADRVKYGSVVFAGNFLDTLVLVAVGLLFGRLIEVLWALLAVVLVRSFSGGAHAQNSWVCMILSVGFYVVALVVTQAIYVHLLPYFSYLLVLVILSGTLLFTKFAPVELKQKPFKSEQHRLNLKRMSYVALLVSAGFVCFVPNDFGKVLCLIALAWQTLQVTPVVERWTERAENFLLFRGGET